MPSSSCGTPKAKRAWPVWLSMPTSPIASPRKRLARPRSVDSPSTAETVVKARTISAKYSGGPNLSPSSTTSGERKVRPTVAMVPATNEPMALVASAGPARPRLAIWLPSIAVTMVALSPGVLSRIDVVEPPYIAP